MLIKSNTQHLWPMLQSILNKDTLARLSRWVTLLLLVALVWTLGRLFWQVITPPESAAPTPKAVSGQVAVAHSPQYRLDEVINRHLFGRYSEKAAPVVKQEPVVSAPKTTLRLNLVGLVASSEPSRGLAVIANRGAQKTYGVGEAIEGTRVVLRQVLVDRVILRNNGRDEALMLEGVEYEADGRAVSPEKKVQVPQAAKSPVPSNDGLSQVRAEILENPQALLKYITLSQVQGEDGLVGYRVSPGSDNRLFKEAGLEPGDIAVGLNGADLTNPAEINRIWQSLSDASELNLTVQRDGQLHDIYISL